MYKGKTLIVCSRPWWRHPILPWGWYSLLLDQLPTDIELVADGFKTPDDLNGGKYILRAEPDYDPGDDIVSDDDYGKWIRDLELG